MSEQPDIVERLEKALDIIETGFRKPFDHLPGCLFKDNRRMPCQCDPAGRVKRFRDDALAFLDEQRLLLSAPERLRRAAPAADRNAVIEECAKVAARFSKECREAIKHYATAGDGSDTQCMVEALLAKEIEIAIRALASKQDAAVEGAGQGFVGNPTKEP